MEDSMFFFNTSIATATIIFAILMVLLVALLVLRRWKRMRQGIVFLSAFDMFFPNPPNTDSDTAKKCRRLGPRSIFLPLLFSNPAGKQPIVVLYSALQESFSDYLQRVLGDKMPMIISPQSLLEGPLDLAGSVLADNAAMSYLQTMQGYSAEGLINHPRLSIVAQLARLGGGGPIDNLRRLVTTTLLNNKKWFQRFTVWFIETPPSRYCRGVGEVVGAAVDFFARAHNEGVMLRLAVSAGGLGNRRLRSMDDVCDFLRSQIDGMDASAEWRTYDVLVEPFLPFREVYATTIQVTWLGPRWIGLYDRQVLDGKESSGVTYPSRLDPLTPQARAMRYKTLLYGWILWFLQYRGWADIDWAVLMDGRLVAFESNARFLAHSVGYAIWLHLLGGKGVFCTNDHLHVSHTATLEGLLSYLGEKGILWMPGMNKGVIITVPPGMESLSYVICAQTHEELDAVTAVLKNWAESTFQSEAA